MVSEIISAIGQDNFQAIIALLVTTLLGKSSWDMYTSKTLVKKMDVDESVSALKKEIQAQIDEAREQMKLAKDELVGELKSDVADAKKQATVVSKKFDEIESKFKSFEVRTEDLNSKVTGVLDKVIDRPRVSRDEARRLKDSIKKN